MACCKSKEYGGWCKNEKIVHTDGDSKYCIFHAPADKKGLPIEQFNALIYEKIEKLKEDNSAKKINNECNLSGTVFPGDIDFSRFDSSTPLPSISFIGATFNGDTSFESVTICGVARFNEAVFNDVATFYRTTFNDVANFLGATFNSTAYFEEANFSSDVLFGGVAFSSRAIFSRTTFRGKVYFSSAIFKDKVHFVAATFNSKGYFRHTIFSRVNDWENAKISDTIIFERIDLSRSRFLYVDLRNLNIINCKWGKRPLFALLPSLNKYQHNALYDEAELFDVVDEAPVIGVKARLLRVWKGFKKDLSCDTERVKLVEDLYRKLKQKYKEEHNDFEVSNWHYAEKEMFRKSSRLRRFFGVSYLYWLSSGYGERPVRAGIVLLVLVVALSLIFGTVTKSADVQSFEGFSSLVLNALQYATFQKDLQYTPSTLWGKWLKMLCQLLLPVQAALFAFALRNKFRR